MIQVGPPTVTLEHIRNMLKTIPDPFPMQPGSWEEWRKVADETLVAAQSRLTADEGMVRVISDGVCCDHSRCYDDDTPLSAPCPKVVAALAAAGLTAEGEGRP